MCFLNITWSIDKQLTVKGTVICFGISFIQQFEDKAVVLCSGECLQHGNGRHHTARQTAKQIQDPKLEVLTHTPYSPYFTPNDFYLFWSPKDSLRGRHFVSDEEV